MNISWDVKTLYISVRGDLDLKVSKAHHLRRGAGSWRSNPMRFISPSVSRDVPVSCTRACETSAGCLRSICLVHPGVRDKRRVSEIDLSQPRHETAFWWRHNGSVTSQLTDPIKWPNYPLELIRIYVHINTHNKEFLQQRCRRSTNVRLCLIYSYISIWFES